MDYFGPGFVERLVPDGGCERDGIEGFGAGADYGDAVVIGIFSQVGGDEVHFVDKDVDCAAGRELAESTYDGSVGEEVAVEVAGFDVKDVD